MEKQVKNQKRNRTACCLALVLVLIIIAALQACGGAKHVRKVTFVFTADENINDERSVYIVVRKVNKKAFLAESYDEVANSVFADPIDPAVLASRILMPGTEEKISMEIVKPDDVNIGVYALFASPGKNWKLLLETPLESKYAIKVKQSHLECRNIVNE